MAELVVDVFVSADGFAGGAGLPAYFGYDGPQLQEWIARESQAPQLAVMGRRTYEALAAVPDAVQDDGWRAMASRETVVFSRTIRETVWPLTRICADDAVAEVARLKDSSAVPLRTVGSVSLARQLLAAGLVDRLRLMTFPLLAGPDGRESTFAGMTGPVALELTGADVLDDRLVCLDYRPTGADIPRA